MKVTVFGTGYVGLVTSACLAEVGNDVLCIDVDEKRISCLKQGSIPFYEPGLEQLLERNRVAGSLKFTTNPKEAVEHGLLLFIAVGTPAEEDGSADLLHVLEVAETIGRYMSDYKIIINKSTVPVGTANKVNDRIKQANTIQSRRADFDVISNPEFLKEGSAIDDFMKPDRIIIGSNSPRAAKLFRKLYAPFNRNHDRMMVMDTPSAELTKYAANIMLASKISLINELANLAEYLGADIEQVRQGVGADSRIGYAFIYPGCGYGGSCFHKDISALTHTAKKAGYRAELLEAIESVNQHQKNRLFYKIHAHFKGDLAGKSIAIWGLSFKPNTDDMREAPSCALMEALWEAGAKTVAYDPIAHKEAKRLYEGNGNLVLADTPGAALKDADALALVTEWRIFQSPEFDDMKRLMKNPVIFDGRNIYDPSLLKSKGFIYYGIGRGHQYDSLES